MGIVLIALFISLFCVSHEVQLDPDTQVRKTYWLVILMKSAHLPTTPLTHSKGINIVCVRELVIIMDMFELYLLDKANKGDKKAGEQYKELLWLRIKIGCYIAFFGFSIIFILETIFGK